ncbi:MAG: LysR family transcriptional regulator [Devosia sp.]|nr:LysR family transcriptional regulator [Devosia sp.]
MDDLDWRILSELRATPNITRTAERLNMTQSALSKRLQQIEGKMNVRVVVRFSRGITFTPEGEYLADRAGEILERLNDVRKTLLRVGGGESGTIRLGMTNGFARSTLPPYLKDYKLRYRRVETDVIADISVNIIDLLKKYAIHVGFICGETECEFGRMLVSTEQACVVNKGPIELDELPGLPQIVYLRDPFSKRLLDGWWHDRFAEPPMIGMHANHGDTCREMILAGLGYGIFLSRVFVGEANGLFQLPLVFRDGSPLTRNSWMVWQKEFAEVPLVANFIGYMKANLPPVAYRAETGVSCPIVPG